MVEGAVAGQQAGRQHGHAAKVPQDLPGCQRCRTDLAIGLGSGFRNVDLEEDGMGRKSADDNGSEQRERRPRGKRRLAMLLAITGGAVYLVRRNQRRAKIDEGVWHDAPSA